MSPVIYTVPHCPARVLSADFIALKAGQNYIISKQIQEFLGV